MSIFFLLLLFCSLLSHRAPNKDNEEEQEDEDEVVVVEAKPTREETMSTMMHSFVFNREGIFGMMMDDDIRSDSL
jgi:hypothetical protein